MLVLLFVTHKYIVAVNARNSIIMECMIRCAILKKLDDDKLTSEEKISYLKERMESSIKLNLAMLEMEMLDASSFTSVDSSLTDKDVDKIKKNIREYLRKRTEGNLSENSKLTGQTHANNQRAKRAKERNPYEKVDFK